MTATKIDFKREFRSLYLPGREPCLVDVPEMSFLMIDGEGDPNTAAEFREAVEALYSVSFTAKFMVKHLGATDFTVMPLEGLWWIPGEGDFRAADKADWRWTAMLMQPAPVTPEIVDAACRQAGEKRPLPALARLRYESFDEGHAAQVLYIGSYADEGPTIERLHEFIAEQGFEPAGKHHEIYLGDPRRTAPERLKTVIRHPVRSPR